MEEGRIPPPLPQISSGQNDIKLFRWRKEPKHAYRAEIRSVAVDSVIALKARNSDPERESRQDCINKTVEKKFYFLSSSFKNMSNKKHLADKVSTIFNKIRSTPYQKNHRTGSPADMVLLKLHFKRFWWVSHENSADSFHNCMSLTLVKIV